MPIVEAAALPEPPAVLGKAEAGGDDGVEAPGRNRSGAGDRDAHAQAASASGRQGVGEVQLPSGSSRQGEMAEIPARQVQRIEHIDLAPGGAVAADLPQMIPAGQAPQPARQGVCGEALLKGGEAAANLAQAPAQTAAG